METNVGAHVSGQVLTPIAHIPQRLHSRQFWQIQTLVFLATASHYVIEIAGYTSPTGAFHDAAITLYIVPLLYASLTFGWEGALMTALWAVVLTSPSMWIWHHSELHWLTEVAQLAFTSAVGMVVAWRVDREARERLRAEKTSANLNLLKTVGEMLSHTLDVEQQLPLVVHELRSSLALGSISLCLEPDTSGGNPLIVEAGDQPSSPATRPQVARPGVAVAHEPVIEDGRTALIPLMAEGGTLGLLAATAVPEAVLTDEQVELLAAVAREVSVAVANARLYRQRQESLQAYARQVTQAQEEERLRIARELHDETAQELVHLVRKLEQLGQDAGPPLAGPVAEASEVARDILQSVRRFSRDLRPSILDDLGLLAAIEMVVEDAQSHLPGGARLRISGEPYRLDSQVELALFRIAQEALRNVEKHACATAATIDLCFGDEEIRLTVADDGVGFEPPKNVSDLVRSGKLGLVGMKERAESIGGTFELQPGPGKGVGLVVRVRRSQEAASPPRERLL